MVRKRSGVAAEKCPKRHPYDFLPDTITCIGFHNGIEFQNRLGCSTLEVFAAYYHPDAIIDI